MNTTAKLTSAPTPSAGLSLNGEHVFQDVAQRGLPHAGSPAGNLYDGLCDHLIVMGNLDADALNTLRPTRSTRTQP
jgi:hypothetical protein